MMKILTGDERREPEPDAPMRTLNSLEIAACSSAEVTRDGWTVFATWYLNWGDAQLPAGPERIQVFLSPDADNETRRRGLNSTVLRSSVEPALVEAIRQLAAPGQSGGPSMAEMIAQMRDHLSRQARERLAELPRPRADAEGYYGTLLDTYEQIKASGVADPVGVLQEALSPNKGNPVPRGTVLSRLRKARKVINQHRGLE
jgi:hypothetical protein